MTHWFDDLCKQSAADVGVSRRNILGAMLLSLRAAGLGTAVRTASAQPPPPEVCQITRSGGKRTIVLNIGDKINAVPITLQSTDTLTPGRKTSVSVGWTLTSDTSILEGQQQILRMQRSADPSSGQIGMEFGRGYSGAKTVLFKVAADNRTVTGSIDGRPFVPFLIGSKPAFADGAPLPVISADPTIKSAVTRTFKAADPAYRQCGSTRIQSSTACDLCGLACGAKYSSCLLAVVGGAFWEILSCFSDLNDCYSSCNSPGNACCSASCAVDGGCCVDGATCCGSGILAKCCSSGQACCDYTDAGGDHGYCCPSGQVCRVSGQAGFAVCCPPGNFLCHGSMCCPPGGACCGDSGCCSPGTHCADPQFSFCCPNDFVACGAETCCGPSATSVCVAGTLCCKTSDMCGSTCCPGGPCINGNCCPSPSHICGNTCCPPLNACCGTTCCNVNEVCLRDQGGPIGCCPASQACGTVCCGAGQSCTNSQEAICAACPTGQVTCQSENNQPGFPSTVCCAPGVSCCNGKCCSTTTAICCTNLFQPPLVFGCHEESLCIQ